MFRWDKVTRDKDGKVVLLYRHQRILDEELVVPGMKILDVGGWGILAQRLIEEGCECVILDNFSEDQYYSERVKNLPHIYGDITWASELAYWGTGTYDVVTCFEMLEHCQNQSLGVRNMYKMLKPGGLIVGTFPIPGVVHHVGEPGVHFLNEPELRTLLLNSGFINVEIEPTGSVSKSDPPCSLYFKARKHHE